MRASHVDFALMAREAKRFFTTLALNELMSFALLEFIVLKFEKALDAVFKLKPLCVFRSASLDIFENSENCETTSTKAIISIA